MSGWRVTGNPNILRTECPDCGDDASGHLYLYLTSEFPNAYCFRCGRYSSYQRLKEVFDDLPQSSEDLSSARSLDQAVSILKGRAQDEPPEIELPESVPAWKDKRSRSYLKNRGVPDHLTLLHNIRFCREGELKDRVIVPVYFKRKPRTFSARDITGRKPKKYLFPLGASSGSFLFNLDNIQGRWVVVVEGAFDALHLQRYHIPVVASFGKKLTLTQQELLRRFNKIILLFDSDAQKETSHYLSKLPQAQAVLLPRGDPTNYSEEEILTLLRNRLSKLDVAMSLLGRDHV